MRRELNESEKFLLNKYSEIDSVNNEIENNNNLKSISKYKNDFYIREIENKLHNDNNFNYRNNNEYNKINFENILDNNNITNTYKNSKDIVNKYIKPQSHNLKNIDYNKTYNDKYNNKSIVNYNFISLTESLLYKTQNIIFPSKIEKTNLKNNSCKNIFCFKRDKKEENIIKKKDDDSPKFMNNKNEISEYFYKDNERKKKLKNSNQKKNYNLSEINFIKKKGNKLDEINEEKIEKINYKKYFFNKKLSSINTKVIKPYKYFSTNNNNKKFKNKIANINNNNNNNKNKKKMKHYLQTDINIEEVAKIIKGLNNKYNENNKLNRQEKKEFKKTFLQHSSIMAGLIYKNKKYF